jgi:hypothetical protein
VVAVMAHTLNRLGVLALAILLLFCVTMLVVEIRDITIWMP